MRGKLNLPPIGTEVLVISENPHTNSTIYTIAKRIKTVVLPDGRFHFADPARGKFVTYVTHWMPLPEVYSDNVQPVRSTY